MEEEDAEVSRIGDTASISSLCPTQAKSDLGQHPPAASAALQEQPGVRGQSPPGHGSWI